MGIVKFIETLVVEILSIFFNRTLKICEPKLLAVNPASLSTSLNPHKCQNFTNFNQGGSRIYVPETYRSGNAYKKSGPSKCLRGTPVAPPSILLLTP